MKRISLTCLWLACFAALWACGSDRDPFSGQIAVHIDPARAVYAPGDRVAVMAEVVDMMGEPVMDASIRWEAEGASETEVPGDWVLESEGVVRFTACARLPGEREGCGHREILVDASAPMLMVTAPDPGEELSGAEDDSIVVTGTVSDSNGNLEVFINGQRTDVDSAGAFRRELSPKLGVNHIEVVAIDGHQIAQAARELDVLWAPDYEAGDGTTFSVDEGLLMRFGQSVFDDGVSPSIDADRTPSANDVADLVRLVLVHTDPAAVLPEPLVSDGTLTLSIDAMTLRSPGASVRLRDGTLELFVRAGDTELAVTGTYNDGVTNVDLAGVLTATVAFDGILDVVETPEGFAVELSDVLIGVEELRANFDADATDAAFAQPDGALEPALSMALADHFLPSVVEGSVLPVLRGTFESIEGTLSGESVVVETDFSDPIQLLIDSVPTEFAASHLSGLRAAFRTTVSADISPLHPDSRGLPIFAPTPDAPFVQEDELQVGTRVALFNAMLHILWNAGIAEVELDDVAGGTATLSARLPPVLHAPQRGEASDLVVELGQVEISVPAGGESLRFGMNVTVPANVEIFGETFGLVTEEPQVRVWAMSDTETAVATLPVVQGIAEARVAQSFAVAVQEGLRFPLPSFGLAGLSTPAPTLNALELSYTPTRPVDPRYGYAVIGTAVDFRSP